jgi:hypothetical protein
MKQQTFRPILKTTWKKSQCLFFIVAVASALPCGWAKRAHGQPRELHQFLGDWTDGLVDQYLVSPYGEIDGLLLQNGVQVRLPPHVSSWVAEVVKPGNPVRVWGRWEARPVFHATELQNLSGGKSFFVPPRSAWPPEPPPVVRAGLAQVKKIQIQGRLKCLLYSPHGEIEGFVLERGCTIHFPREVAGG